MSDRFVPVQAKVWENLQLGTPPEDQPSPYFDGAVASLVYDLSQFEEEDGVLVRQPTPVTQQNLGNLNTAKSGVNNLGPGSTNRSTVVAQSSTRRDVDALSVIVEPENIVTGTYSGLVEILLVDTGGTPPTNEFPVFQRAFQDDFQDQLAITANQDADFLVEGDYELVLRLTNNSTSPDDIRTTGTAAFTE